MPIEAPLAAQASMPGHPATDHQSAPLLQAKGGLVHGRGHRASRPRRAAAVPDGDSAAE